MYHIRPKWHKNAPTEVGVLARKEGFEPNNKSLNSLWRKHSVISWELLWEPVKASWSLFFAQTLEEISYIVVYFISFLV